MNVFFGVNRRMAVVTRTIYLVLPVVATAACVTSKLSPQVRQTVDLRHRGSRVDLRHSCYYGDLYDENEKWLLTPYPFADVSHLTDLKGHPIHPANERGILPAGTELEILQVEFPDGVSLAGRLLTTPRTRPWVYLRRVPHDDAPPFVILLPEGLRSEAGVEQAIANALAPAGNIQRWLRTRRPSVQAAIAHKSVVTDMTLSELTTSWGEPLLWFSDTKEGRQARVAWYRSREVWLIDGKVIAPGPRSPRPAPDEAPHPSAAASTAPARWPAQPPSHKPLRIRLLLTSAPQRYMHRSGQRQTWRRKYG